jgi:uncharacterized protein YecE (DUF72 family)
MKFGALPQNRLADIDLSLPKEPISNALILPGARALHPKFYIGAARWGHSSWAGEIYPSKTKASAFRELYPNYFSAVELNATHYKIYSPQVLAQWREIAKGKDFKFCPKFPQAISHYSNFKNAGVLTDQFLESILAFSNNLGPAFLQLSESYSPAQKDGLFSYLASLPKDMNFFLELRHPGWFANEKIKESLFNKLRELKIGAVITDAPGRRDVAHMHLTLPKLFVRFVCNSLHASSLSRTDDWVQHLKRWIDEGLEETYIFLHPGDDAAIPGLADYWVKEINKHCQLNLSNPTISQKTLFD